MKTTLQNKKIAAETKQRNIPFYLDAAAVLDLIGRIAGDAYREHFVIRQINAVQPGMDRYHICDLEDGKILIEATSGVAAAVAFRWYLENRCDSYIGPLTRRVNFPENPPSVGLAHNDDSLCLYRYFLNYCTYGYTFLFWQWEQWENLLDWMMLAGYNLILNPVGNESVWLAALQQLGYTLEQARAFICSPAVFPWQCMNNVASWSGAASMEYYQKRLQLAHKINDRIRSFGAEIVAPGWSGMVPSDFENHRPNSKPIHQGLWCGMPRPSILTAEDPNFAPVGYYFYKNTKELIGDVKFFSTDPFHEGGDSSQVDLDAYAKGCLRQMKEFSPDAVWFLQGWGKNPIRKLLQALPVSEVLIGDLCTIFHQLEDNFADYPWLYGTVDNFGGQRRFRGNMNTLIADPLNYAKNEDLSMVGLAMFPEGLDTDEMMFDVIADYAVSSVQQEPDEWLRKRLRIRYGADSESAFEGWRLIRDYIYIGKEPRDSGLLSRPSLTVAHVICQTYELTYDNDILRKAVQLLYQDYDLLCESEAYRMDLMDAARQWLGNHSWEIIKKIQNSYYIKDLDTFEKNAELLMTYYDIQERLTGTDRHAMLGPWLELAKAVGNTPAEKAYMEFQARTIITLWGDRAGSEELHDYAAREWNGMLSDFYRPRWESYLNILRCSFVTGNKPLDYNRYDAEYYFTTLSKSYPTEPSGDLQQIVGEVLSLAQTNM